MKWLTRFILLHEDSIILLLCTMFYLLAGIWIGINLAPKPASCLSQVCDSSTVNVISNRGAKTFVCRESDRGFRWLETYPNRPNYRGAPLAHP